MRCAIRPSRRSGAHERSSRRSCRAEGCARHAARAHVRTGRARPLRRDLRRGGLQVPVLAGLVRQCRVGCFLRTRANGADPSRALMGGGLRSPRSLGRGPGASRPSRPRSSIFATRACVSRSSSQETDALRTSRLIHLEEPDRRRRPYRSGSVRQPNGDSAPASREGGTVVEWQRGCQEKIRREARV